MIPPYGARLGEVVADHKARAAFVKRIHALGSYTHTDDPVVEFGEAELDAARAAGCLVEYVSDRAGFRRSVAFITDATFAVDLVDRFLEQWEKDAEKRAEEEAAWKARRTELGESEPRAGDRKAKRKEAKEDAERGRAFNQDLGRNLFKGRTARRRKQHGLARAKALALIVIADNTKLAAAGLRLVDTRLQTIESKTLKSGAQRHKVNYAESEDCTTDLLRRVNDAESAEMVLEVMSEALIAGLLADQKELPGSRRVHWCSSVESQLTRLLASDVKSVRPRRAARRK
jgi:hypothetical protein